MRRWLWMSQATVQTMYDESSDDDDDESVRARARTQRVDGMCTVGDVELYDHGLTTMTGDASEWFVRLPVGPSDTRDMRDNGYASDRMDLRNLAPDNRSAASRYRQCRSRMARIRIGFHADRNRVRQIRMRVQIARRCASVMHVADTSCARAQPGKASSYAMPDSDDECPDMHQFRAYAAVRMRTHARTPCAVLHADRCAVARACAPVPVTPTMHAHTGHAQRAQRRARACGSEFGVGAQSSDKWMERLRVQQSANKFATKYNKLQHSYSKCHRQIEYAAAPPVNMRGRNTRGYGGCGTSDAGSVDIG